MKSFYIVICLCSSIILIGCNSPKNLKSTSLDKITINNIKIDYDINDIDLREYVKSNRFSKGNAKYYFENVVIDVNEKDQVNYLFGFYKENNMIINGKTNLKSISEITELLKDKYIEAWEDREQQLKHHIYHDKNNKIILKVVYSDITKEIVWLEISSSDYTHSS